MESASPAPNNALKAMYESPQIGVIHFSCEDVLAVSANGDENQGEWDLQKIIFAF